MANWRRNYWGYSACCAVVWAVVLILAASGSLGSRATGVMPFVFLGFCIGWVSTTIARYVYPPPRRWEGKHW